MDGSGKVAEAPDGGRQKVGLGSSKRVDLMEGALAGAFARPDTHRQGFKNLAPHCVLLSDAKIRSRLATSPHARF